jgi:hypothetical protein
MDSTGASSSAVKARPVFSIWSAALPVCSAMLREKVNEIFGVQ